MSKPYTYQKGKFVVPLEDIDPLQYLESKATASIPLKDITPEVALQVLKHNPKELKKAPWSVRHNILTALLGGGVGMGAGAGIGRLFKRHRPFSTAVGGLLGLTLGAETGNIYSDIKSLKKVEQLAKQKKLKTASFQAAFFDELEKIKKEAGIKGQITPSQAPMVHANTMHQLANKGITPEMHATMLSKRMKQLPLAQQQVWMGKMRGLYPDTALKVQSAMRKTAVADPDMYGWGARRQNPLAGVGKVLGAVGRSVDTVGKPSPKRKMTAGSMLGAAGKFLGKPPTVRY